MIITPDGTVMITDLDGAMIIADPGDSDDN